MGCDNVSYEGCDAQPVNILSDYRAYTLLDAYKGRENLFKVFDSHPHNSRVNVKFGSIKPVNSVNILEHTINNLDNVVENTTAAESQIRDTDMATEMVKYSNANILSQAGQSMLAQGNQANQGVLSLLG